MSTLSLVVVFVVVVRDAYICLHRQITMSYTIRFLHTNNNVNIIIWGKRERRQETERGKGKEREREGEPTL